MGCGDEVGETLKKKYPVVPNVKQLKAIKGYWKLFCKTHDEFYRQVNKIEKLMEAETGIEGIMFFCADGQWCGVGDCHRKMKLIQLDPV